MKRALVSGLVALALAACTTPPTVYQPAADSQSMGYREFKIEDDRYRVSFRSNADVRGAALDDLVLRRTAEIAQREGRTWFRVVNRSNELVSGYNRGGTSVGVGGSSGSYGSSVGVGIGLDLSPDSRKYEATMEVLLGTGAKPDDPSAYDVQSVLAGVR
jgi:hypothetical protein